MAGRPRRTAMIHALEKRTREWAQVHDEDQSDIYDALDYAESWIASGKTLLRLADEISDEVGFEISRDMLKRHLSEGRRDEASRRLNEARMDGAHGLVEQAVKIVDDAPTADKEQLQKAKMKAETRLWAAERWNRTDLGKAPDVAITVNNNSVFLDALRVRQVQLGQQHGERGLEVAPARSLERVTSTHSDEVVIDAVIEPGDEPS